MTKCDVKVTVGIPTFNRASSLRESVASVLSQSYRDFRLLICDNASEDDTQQVVASFADSRIDYVRSNENIGMSPNFNRVIELAETEFLIILPDDDLLYPDHLRCAVEVFERYPSVGVVHTAFDVINGSSHVQEYGRTLLPVAGPLTIEPGDAYLDRSMVSPWTVCWSSALFRRCAILEAGGFRAADEPLPDFPLMMRIACGWDFACLSRSLVAFRLHADAATAALGSYTGAGYDLLDALPEILHTQRRRFLDDATLPEARARRYRSLAEGAFRQDKLTRLADRAVTGAPWWSTSKAFARLVCSNPRALLLPRTGRLFVAHLGGRQAKRAARRLRTWASNGY